MGGHVGIAAGLSRCRNCSDGVAPCPAAAELGIAAASLNNMGARITLLMGEPCYEAGFWVRRVESKGRPLRTAVLEGAGW